jgi:HrpA-like RNA helicase
MQLIKVFDTIEIQEHEARMENRRHSELHRGSVLVFLPGIHEIEDLYSQLNAQ